MNRDQPPDRKASQSRLQWLYWVLVPTTSLAYGLFCVWFTLEAWGRRGEVKPDWFEAAFVLALPGMMLPIPLLGPILVGGVLGSGLAWLIQQMWRRHRSSTRRSSP